jgi:ABC-2 type transport system permease protein
VALLLVTLMTESFEQFTFSEQLYDGTISHDLLRPQPVVINTIGTNIAIRSWLSLTAFWTERVHSIVGFGSYLNYLIGGTVAPLAFLPEPWRGLGQVLPFYGMLGLPANGEALQAAGAELFAESPSIEHLDVIAAKLPRRRLPSAPAAEANFQLAVTAQ